jgi:murein DD-endopeptidase MepM/ murein hydrolase activator NlpD
MRRLLVLGVLLLLGVPAQPASAAGFGWPLAGLPEVDRAFEPPRTAYGTGHRGVDLRASPGQDVLAAGPGRVTYAGVLAGRGVVTVTHDGGLRTTYEPVSASVRVGRQVARGAVLGQLSSGHPSCRAGTTCLHWGLLRADTYLDPLALVGSPPLRLLPLGTDVAAAARQVARPGPPRDGLTGAARGVAAVAAAGSLALGVGLLARRGSVRPPPPGAPPAPVDLQVERRRRRAG